MSEPRTSLSPERGRELLRAVVEAEAGDPAADAADALLRFLLRQLELLRGLANGYPRNPIDGHVWADGKALAELCDELADVLAERKHPEQEELASRLAVGMALQVMSHYPEEIFPRIVRNGRCREGIGHEQEAVDGYDAILQDFHRLDLVELLEDREVDETSQVIVSALAYAVSRLAALRPERRATLSALEGLLTRWLERAE